MRKEGIIINYMSTKEAAEKWGVTVNTVSKWCREDKIIFIAKPEKVGGQWRIPVDAKYPIVNKNKQNSCIKN